VYAAPSDDVLIADRVNHPLRRLREIDSISDLPNSVESVDKATLMAFSNIYLMVVACAVMGAFMLAVVGFVLTRRLWRITTVEQKANYELL